MDRNVKCRNTVVATQSKMAAITVKGSIDAAAQKNVTAEFAGHHHECCETSFEVSLGSDPCQMNQRFNETQGIKESKK